MRRSFCWVPSANGNGTAHSAFVEHWYDSVTKDGLDLMSVIVALQAWLPGMTARSGSPDTQASLSQSPALEEQVLAAALRRLPTDLRPFSVTIVQS